MLKNVWKRGSSDRQTARSQLLYSVCTRPQQEEQEFSLARSLLRFNKCGLKVGSNPAGWDASGKAAESEQNRQYHFLGFLSLISRICLGPRRVWKRP